MLLMMSAILFKTEFLICLLISLLLIDLREAMERLILLKKVTLRSFDMPVSKVFLLLSIVSTLVFKSVRFVFKEKLQIF